MLIAKCVAGLLGAGLLLPLTLTDTDPEPAPGHCMIPCGIFDDAARFKELAEHIVTIEKSMKPIVGLQADPANSNQLVRWVLNKEEHADAFAQVMLKYFLQQRIKLAEAEKDPTAYGAGLASAHKLVVLAMKASTDMGYIKALRMELHNFEVLYTGKHSHDHDHSDHKH